MPAQTVLITGACGGLGRATAEAFLVAGKNVVVCDINEELIAQFKAEVVSKFGEERILVVKTDVTDENDLNALFSQALAKFDQIDSIVNNAGLMDKFDAVGEVKRTLWDRIMAVNSTAPMVILQWAVNHWLERGIKGSAVNIASIGVLRSSAAGVAYTVSKHALLGLTKHTAGFYENKGIRCNAIQAGAMETNIVSAFQSELNMSNLERMQAMNPEAMRPIVELHNVANTVVFLCSDAAAGINGAALSVDRGWSAH